MATFRSRSRSSVRSATSGASTRRPGSPLPRAEPRPFFAAIEDLNRGAIPTNEQLKAWLKYLGRSFDVPTGKLSNAGRGLVRDIQELVGLLGTVIDERNRDELLQRFFTHSRLAGKLAMQSLGKTGRIAIIKEPRRQVYLFGSRDTEAAEKSLRIRKEATKEVKALYRLLQLIIASPDVRGTVKELQEIVRLVLSDEHGAGDANSALGKKKVSFEREEGLLGTKDKTTSGTTSAKYTESTGLSGSDLDRSIERLRQQVQQTSADIHEMEFHKLSATVGGARSVTTETSKEGEWTYVSKGYQRKGEAISGGETSGGETSGGIRKLRSESDFPEVPLEQAEKLPIFGAEETEEEREGFGVDSTSAIKEQVVPEERPVEPTGPSGPSRTDREIVERVRRLLIGISGNAELRKSMADAVEYVQSLQALGMEAARDPTGPIPSELQYEENIKAAQRDLLRILERFAGGASLDPAVKIVTNLRGAVMSDYELKDFFGDWSAFLRRCFEDEPYLKGEEFGHRLDFLLGRTRTLGRDKYGQQFHELNRTVTDFLSGWQNDRLTTQVGTVMQRLVKEDILGTQTSNDSTAGGLFFALMRPDLMQDFRNVILPSMLGNLHEIPIPRIESISDSNRLVLENIVIPAGGFVPVDLDVRQSSSLKMSPRERLYGHGGTSVREKMTSTKLRQGWHNAVRVRLGGMHAAVRDVRFEIEKATGWPKLHDDGLADLRFAGRGMTITMNILAASSGSGGSRPFFSRGATKRARSYLEPTFVRVKIDRLALKMHDTRRDWMYKVMSPFLAARVKRTIERSLRDQIVASIRGIDSLTRSVTAGLYSQ